MSVTTIGFDADDTLWENERFFHQTEAAFQRLLADYLDKDALAAEMLATERKNIPLYGFGIKGFTLSMVETALRVSDNKIPQSVIAEIVDLGRDMLSHPVELLPDVRETLDALKGRYNLILITKGDLHHQEMKINASGLDHYFDGIEIVSDKDQGTYAYAFDKYGDGAARGVMIGNSLKSDVIPMLDAGGYGVYMPHNLEWAFERADEPTAHPRFKKLSAMKEFAELIGTWAD